MKTREVSPWVSAPLIAGTLGLLLWLEKRRPLRRRVENKARRDARNLAMAALSAAAISRFEAPVVRPLARAVEERRLGLLKVARLPLWVEVPLAVLLLDYTLYVWHVLTHRVPFLWRFHGVHHADRDLTATTAVRFHFAEMILSVPWRAAQVLVVGASPLSLSAWQTVTTVAILFHHSNVELPLGVERWLCRLVVTPRVHGIHHSVVRAETDSNWSTIFMWPDYVHGTARLDVAQDAITIGIPDVRERLTLGELVRLPFSGDAPDQHRFAGGWRPPQSPLLGPRDTRAASLR